MTDIEKQAIQVQKETGMWPEDLVARVKELEEALETTCNVHDFICANLGDSPKLSLLQYGNAAEHARAILNKKP